MSYVKVVTRDFVGLVTDSVLTAGNAPDESPVLATVLLDTDHAEVEITADDDGAALIDFVPSDVLVATSTDGLNMAGQCHCPCSGRLHKPVLISRLDAESLVRVFTPLGKAAAKGVVHQVLVEVSGDRVSVREDPDQRSDGVVVSLQALDLTDYPSNWERALVPDVDSPVIDAKTGEEIPASYGSGLPASSFEVVGKVGKRRKMLPAWYRHHHHRGVVVTVGSMWRALFVAPRLDEDAGEHLEPRVPVFVPRLPEEKREVETPPLAAV